MEKWIKFLRPYGLAGVCGLLMAMVWPLTETTKTVEASSIKNWTSNEYIRYSDLNTVVNHLHANLGHGHGAIITANDIASNAQIRPEQTTFGLSINRALVHIGTYYTNPDGGNYLPLNYSGELAVSVVPTSTADLTITGAAAAGALSDGGTSIYTVFYRPVRIGADPLITCSDSTAVVTSLASPLSVRLICADTLSLVAGPTTYTRPSGLSVEVYSNKVQ